jgi:hypothetical protein
VASLGGGVFIALGDHLFHVRTGVLVHHWHPQWDGQALVVVPIFVVAAAAMLVSASVVLRLVPGRPAFFDRFVEGASGPPGTATEGPTPLAGVRPTGDPGSGHLPVPGLPQVLLAGVAFYLAYALTGWIGTNQPWWCLFVLLDALLLRLWVSFEPWRVLAVGVVIGLGGCAGEAAISAIGLFDYIHRDVAGIPFWLFPLYLHGAFAVVALTRWLEARTWEWSSGGNERRPHEHRGEGRGSAGFRPRTRP